MQTIRFCLAAVLAATASPAVAVTVSSSASPTLTTPDNTATFLPIANDDSLLNYTEDGLIVSVDDTQFEPLDAFGDGLTDLVHYGRSGNNGFVTIARTDASLIEALEFRKGTGFIPCRPDGTGCSFVWEALRAGSVIDGGRVENYDLGDYYLFTDVLGFDEFRVASFGNLTDDFGGAQGIALGDVRVSSVETNTVVPLPASGVLLLGGLAWLGVAARRRGLGPRRAPGRGSSATGVRAGRGPADRP